MRSEKAVAVIIVTHNSQGVLQTNLEHLALQYHEPAKIVVVDSGSADSVYLEKSNASTIIEVHYESNVGFSAGNNIGLPFAQSCADYVLFLNPDAFLTADFIAGAVEYMESPAAEGIAALTGSLLGYDISVHCLTGHLDSTGIFRTWYGKWYDRGQGEPADTGRYAEVEEVPAICGALMFVRRTAIQQLLEKDGFVFDESFFMYKEDIDLSLRLRKLGWRLVYHPGLIAYHCRGWSKSRSSVPRALRMLSARNEVRLCKKHSVWFLPYAYLKLAIVWAFDI